MARASVVFGYGLLVSLFVAAFLLAVLRATSSGAAAKRASGCNSGLPQEISRAEVVRLQQEAQRAAQVARDAYAMWVAKG